jgi:hypothetical protein
MRPIPKTPPYGPLQSYTNRAEYLKLLNVPQSLPSSPTTAITASLLGQPSEVIATKSDIGLENPSSEDSCNDFGVNKVLKVMRRAEGIDSSGLNDPFAVDPKDFIVKERLDERDSLLIDGISFSHTLVLRLRM